MRSAHALLVAAVLPLGLAPAARIADNPNLALGNPNRAREDPADRDNYLLARKFFALAYNDSKGTANWVSWRLVKEDLGDAPRVPFYPDLGLPRGFHQVLPRHYTGSGFDRGHLCPHGDRASSNEASSATFAMSNMIPQAPNVNQGAWADFEDYCRHLVAKEDHRLYVVAGPAGRGGVGKEGRRETIASGRVTVPASC